METLNFKDVIKKHIYHVIATILIFIILQIMEIIIPILVSKIPEIKELRQALYIGLYIVILFILEPVLKIFYGQINRTLQYNITKEIQNLVISKILMLRLINFKKNNNFLKLINDEPKTISSSVVSMISSSIGIIVKLFILLKISNIHWAFGLIYILGILAIIILENFSSRFLKESKRKAKKNNDSIINILNQALVGMSEIRSFNFDIHNYLMNKLNANMKVNFKKEFIKEFSTEVKNLILTFTTLISMIVGGLLILYGNMKISNLLLIFMYREKIMNIVKHFSELKNAKLDLIIAREKILSLQDNKKFPKNQFGNIILNSMKGKIELNNVSFINKDRKIIDNLSLYIKPKSFVGFVGDSGCGKTTVLNLISNFEKISSGSLKIDDIEISDLSENSLRENISVIQQYPVIFNISLRDNILLGTNASDKEIDDACKKACIYDLIQSFPKKYNTILGKDRILSGGEQQRLAIARALLKRSSILLMDEATSALDSITQQKVINSIKKSDKTVILVAHRLETIKDCNQIFVMKKSKLVSSGSHNYLIKHSAEYRKLYNAEEIK